MNYSPPLSGALWRGACLSVLVAVPPAPASEWRDALRASLPSYAPSVPKDPEPPADARARDVPSAAATVDDQPKILPVPKNSEEPHATHGNAFASPVEIAQGVVEMEAIEVNATRLPPPTKKLPRPPPSAPSLRPNENTKDPMLTSAERKARMRRKHLGPLDAVLNPHRLFGSSRAQDAEQREQFAAQMSSFADAVELAAASGENEDELKELRELYLQLYVSRSK